MVLDTGVLEYALDIEAKAEPCADHANVADLFSRAADALPEGDPRREPTLWELHLHKYSLEPEKGLTPLFETEGQVYPQPVETFPEEAVGYFEQRLAQATHPSVRARLADFLWLRHKKFTFAEMAIAEYVRAAQAVLSSSRGRKLACEYLSRAASLALSLGRDPATVLAAIRSLAECFLKDGDGHLARLVEVTARVIDKDSSLSDWLIDKVTKLARRKGTPPAQNRILERRLLEVVLGLAAVRHDATHARSLRLQIARSFEDEASERKAEGGGVQSAMLSKAIRLYQHLGMSDDINRLKPLLHQAHERAAEDTQRVSTSFDIPIDEFRRHVEICLAEGQKRSPFAHLQLFAMNEGYWPPWSQVSDWTAELSQRYPLLALMPKVKITHDGRPFERPHDPDKAREFDEIERYVEDVKMQLTLSARKMEMFRERDAWDEGLLMQALADGALFDEQVLKAVRPGIVAFEAGRHWEALHVLVPQTERIIRKLAKNLGPEAYRYKSDTGELHWASLKMLLSEPAVVQTLGAISPDLARQLDYLFVDSRGWNLRDDVSHGILSPDTDSKRPSLLCVMTLLTLSMLMPDDQTERKQEDPPPADTPVDED